MSARPNSRNRGFTLLEVLVAIAILGLGLTAILSSQVTLFSTEQRGENLTTASALARCRMSETELDLIKLNFPLADENHEGTCCADEDEPGFACSWKIERVKLPDASSGEDDGGAPEDDMGGPLAKIAEVAMGGPQALGENPDLGSIAESLGAGDTQGMGPMVMGLVYPELKPMLEESIRKVTVTVSWKEGRNDRTLNVVQYVTDPRQGNLDAEFSMGDGGAP